MLGTTTWKAGNNIGMTMEERSKNWWEIAYIDDYLRVKRVALMNPNIAPGMNYINFFHWKFYSISKLPKIIISSM
jgi:hypothetical protein